MRIIILTRSKSAHEKVFVKCIEQVKEYGLQVNDEKTKHIGVRCGIIEEKKYVKFTN